MTLAKRSPLYAPAFKTAIEVVNMNSGHVVSFFDDGVDENGLPVRGREGLLTKISMRDEDGDPVFVLGERAGDGYKFSGWPAPRSDEDIKNDRSHKPYVHTVEADREARVKVSAIARTVDDPSNNRKYKTLGDKAVARRKAHEAEEKRIADDRRAGRTPQVVLPPELADLVKVFAAQEVAKADRDATKTIAQARP